MTGYGTPRLRSGLSGSPDCVLDVIRGVTRSLYSTHTVSLLLKQTCEHLVQRGGYTFVWIGSCERRLCPQAWVGNAAGYLDEVPLLCQVPPGEQDPAVQAFCRGELVVDAGLDGRRLSSDRPATAARYGFAAGVGLPLKADSRLHGAIGIYSSKREAFDKASIHLLREMAQTVTYGISRFRLEEELDGLRSLLGDHSFESNRLPVQLGDAIVLLDPDEIYYAQADGHYTRLCSRDQEFFCSQPLRWVAGQLPEKRFLRVHRSYVVNLRHVRAIKSTNRRTWLSFSVSGCGPVPVSRGQITSVRRALGIDSMPPMHC